jgi:hypothetical protein
MQQAQVFVVRHFLALGVYQEPMETSIVIDTKVIGSGLT